MHLKRKKGECYSLEDGIPVFKWLNEFCASWIKDVQKCIGKECVTKDRKELCQEKVSKV